MAFHELILCTGGWIENNLLMGYACGYGGWTTHFALTGSKKVVCFDVGESVIRGDKIGSNIKT
jgi:hypothetical protein